MKVSIVIPVLNSHEVLRRQFLHFKRMDLPADVEIIIVDDGSNPPLEDTVGVKNLVILATGDTRPWTWPLARNKGAELARGNQLIMTDIDHILDKPLIDYVYGFNGDKVQFKREFGVLTEDGEMNQDMVVLRRYGLLPEYDLQVKPLPNNFAMKREVFWRLGGYREDRIGQPYPQREDTDFKSTWTRALANGEVGPVSVHRPTIYVFPNGQFCGDVDYNPFGLFHDLSRKTRRNEFHRRLKRG